MASLGLAALLATQSHAADHLDSATLAGNPMGDINDVYTWMTPDALKLNLAMTVSPGDPGTRAFTDAVQYVFHVTSKAGDPQATVAQAGGTETKVICTFVSNTNVSCWVVTGTATTAYVQGDPSAATGLTSADGKLKVFAGRRSDPFFFNLQGFRNAVDAVHTNVGALTFTADGCPNNLPSTGALSIATILGLLTTLQTTGAGSPACSTTNIDCFAAFNVMALVVQVDKTLVNATGNTIVGVWGSTHAKP
ncbi:MAG: DUF4331 family protein [Myxococcales bacterium]|nr:DUF4331 family protein [Myxococcales bacterium]